MNPKVDSFFDEITALKTAFEALTHGWKSVYLFYSKRTIQNPRVKG